MKRFFAVLFFTWLSALAFAGNTPVMYIKTGDPDIDGPSYTALT